FIDRFNLLTNTGTTNGNIYDSYVDALATAYTEATYNIKASWQSNQYTVYQQIVDYRYDCVFGGCMIDLFPGQTGMCQLIADAFAVQPAYDQAYDFVGMFKLRGINAGYTDEFSSYSQNIENNPYFIINKPYTTANDNQLDSTYPFQANMNSMSKVQFKNDIYNFMYNSTGSDSYINKYVDLFGLQFVSSGTFYEPNAFQITSGGDNGEMVYEFKTYTASGEFLGYETYSIFNNLLSNIDLNNCTYTRGNYPLSLPDIVICKVVGQDYYVYPGDFHTFDYRNYLTGNTGGFVRLEYNNRHLLKDGTGVTSFQVRVPNVASGTVFSFPTLVGMCDDGDPNCPLGSYEIQPETNTSNNTCNTSITVTGIPAIDLSIQTNFDPSTVTKSSPYTILYLTACNNLSTTVNDVQVNLDYQHPNLTFQSFIKQLSGFSYSYSLGALQWNGGSLGPNECRSAAIKFEMTNLGNNPLTEIAYGQIGSVRNGTLNIYGETVTTNNFDDTSVSYTPSGVIDGIIQGSKTYDLSASLYTGTTVDFTLHYENNSSDTGTLNLYDVYPSGLTYTTTVSSPIGLGVHIPSQKTIAWTGVTLAPYASGNIVVRFTIDSTNKIGDYLQNNMNRDITYLKNCGCGNELYLPDNTTSTFDPIILSASSDYDLSIVKSLLTTGTLYVGMDVQFRLTIYLSGDTRSDVMIQDIMPAGFTYTGTTVFTNITGSTGGSVGGGIITRSGLEMSGYTTGYIDFWLHIPSGFTGSFTNTGVVGVNSGGVLIIDPETNTGNNTGSVPGSVERCGDGIIYNLMEQCDLGTGNGVDSACSATCQLNNPVCFGMLISPNPALVTQSVTITASGSVWSNGELIYSGNVLATGSSVSYSTSFNTAGIYSFLYTLTNPLSGLLIATCTGDLTVTNAPITGMCNATIINQTYYTGNLPATGTLCSSGTLTGLTQTTTGRTWSCEGANGGGNDNNCTLSISTCGDGIIGTGIGYTGGYEQCDLGTGNGVDSACSAT
ncbi:MAG TPA: hypothetical protein PLW93_03500, partial [Candidatus Absconditabacterales bacterium]|nr:hypothetical protein [Candidatus Absconditabacterales bacterium]